MDIDTIEPGVDYEDVIKQAVASCDVLLALIGRQWSAVTDSQGRRRLDNKRDFIRLEIEAALHRKVRVIPVLLQGATMPAEEELPHSIAELAMRNALEVSQGRWHYDVGRLIDILQRLAQHNRGGPAERAADVVTLPEAQMPESAEAADVSPVLTPDDSASAEPWPKGGDSARIRSTGRKRALAAAAAAIMLIAGVVVAVLVLGKGSNTPSDAGLAARAVSGGEIDLSWHAVGQAADRILVYRNGVLLKELPPSEIGFRDTTVLPSTTYTYALFAGTSGASSPLGAPVRVETFGPSPLGQARFDGPYSVRTVVTGAEPPDLIGTSEQSTWTFRPNCSAGACVNLGVVIPEIGTINLTHRLQNFSGKGLVHVALCSASSGSLDYRAEVTIQASAARFVDGVWTATAFTGTYDLKPAKDSPCTPFREDSVSGTPSTD